MTYFTCRSFGRRVRPALVRNSRQVNGLRNQKSNLVRQGLEHEEIPPGQKPLNKSLTAERLERLNALGFTWSVMAPKVAWEERFRSCLEYREEHGQWPSQSMGQLGEVSVNVTVLNMCSTLCEPRLFALHSNVHAVGT